VAVLAKKQPRRMCTRWDGGSAVPEPAAGDAVGIATLWRIHSGVVCDRRPQCPMKHISIW